MFGRNKGGKRVIFFEDFLVFLFDEGVLLFVSYIYIIIIRMERI